MTRHNNAVTLVLLMTTVGWRLLSMTDLKSYSMPECVFGETVRHSKSCCCDCFNIHRPQPNLVDPCQYSSVSFLFFCFWLCLTACLFFPYKERFKKRLGACFKIKVNMYDSKINWPFLLLCGFCCHVCQHRGSAFVWTTADTHRTVCMCVHTLCSSLCVSSQTLSPSSHSSLSHCWRQKASANITSPQWSVS